MSYEKTNFKDHEVERPLTFKVQENIDGTITLIPSPGEIVEEGTDLKAEYFNKMEEGIIKALDGAILIDQGNDPDFTNIKYELEVRDGLLGIKVVDIHG